MLAILPNGISRTGTEGCKSQYKHENSIWNIFTEENHGERRVPVSCKGEREAFDEKQHSLGQVNNLTEFQFYLQNYQIHDLIGSSKE